MQQVAELGLVRGVRRWDVVGIMINGIVGAGIFGLPSKIFALTGTYSLLALRLARCSSHWSRFVAQKWRAVSPTPADLICMHTRHSALELASQSGGWHFYQG